MPTPADQHFGIPAAQYGMMAHTALALEKLSRIEPLELAPHGDGRPGAVLFMFGRRHSYFLSLETSADPSTVQLSTCPLDSPKPFHRPVLVLRPDNYSTWLRIAATILDMEQITNPGVLDAFNSGFQEQMRSGWID